MKYRVEQKYLIYEDQMAYIKNNLYQCMKLDPNMKGDSYLIRSIYFDDLYDSCMAENEDGINEREKYRIRAYDMDDSFIRLECKGKRNGFTTKESAPISAELTDRFIEHGGAYGNICSMDLPITGETPGLMKKLYANSCVRAMAPRIIVEYERTAFIDPIGNVRVTFDRNIGGSTNLSLFWEKNIMATPALPAGQMILEVKYDELIPDYISYALDSGGCRHTSFSKYYYARNNEMINY